MTKHFSYFLFSCLLAGFTLACQDNEDQPVPQDQPVRVQFDSAQVIIRENEGSRLVRISFTTPVVQDGALALSVSSASSRFATNPPVIHDRIDVQVTKHQKFATVEITPADNDLIDGDLEFTMTLLDISTDFTLGKRKTMVVKLQDDDAESSASESEANFLPTDRYVSENDPAGKSYPVSLSAPLAAPGAIELSFESAHAVYGAHFITIPAAINGTILLTPAIGDDTVHLTVIPVDNTVLTGELEITFAITGGTGSVIRGTELQQTVVIVDDELAGKPKGYEIQGGQWTLKKAYEYNQEGKVRYVHIEKSSPATSAYTETWFYDATGRIEKINSYPDAARIFIWSGNRIVKSESIENQALKSYIEYDYDEQGNVSGAAHYFRQPDGGYTLGFLNIYLYFLDGNLYKSQTYVPGQDPEEYVLISTKTYDDYLDAGNPFPMVEILPTRKTQTRLPSQYTVEENGVSLRYTLTYEFREDGLATKRTARSGSLVETTHYQYY